MTTDHTQLPSYQRDPDLSFRARGLLAYMLAGDADEPIHAAALAAGAKEGREAVETALTELQAAGYICRERWQLPTGHWRWRSAFGATPEDASARMAELIAAGVSRTAAQPDVPVPSLAAQRPATAAPEWDGTWPLDGEQPPRGRIPVVYVLDPQKRRPLYVGSTDRLRARLRQHSRARAFTQWEAYVCPSRQDAYRFEALTVDRLQPRENGHDLRLAAITGGGAR